MVRRSPSRDDRPRRRAVVVACPRDERGRPDVERAVVSRTVVRVLTATGYRVVAFGVGRGRRAATPATVTAAIARATRAAAAGEVVVVYLACPAWSLRGSTILAVAASPRSRPPRARVRLPLAEVIAGLRQTEAATALFLDVGPAAATLDPGRVVATDAPSLARDERDGGFALLAADAAFAGGLRGPLIAALGGEAAAADGAVGFGAVAEEIQRAARAASVPGARAAPVVRLEIADLALIPAPARRALATPSPIRAVAFAPDGGRLAVGGDDGVVRRFEPRTGAAIDALPPLPAAVGGLAFDRAGRVLQIGGVDGTHRGVGPGAPHVASEPRPGGRAPGAGVERRPPSPGRALRRDDARPGRGAGARRRRRSVRSGGAGPPARAPGDPPRADGSRRRPRSRARDRRAPAAGVRVRRRGPGERRR
jgi:hypothetical protein